MTARCALYMGALKNFERPWVRPRLLFQIFNGILFQSILWRCVQNLKFVVLPVPEIIEIEVLGGGCEPQSWKQEAVGVGMVQFERALVISYRPSIVTLSLSLRVSEILPVLCSSKPLFPTPPSVSPKFPHVPLGVDGWSLDYEERRCLDNSPCN